MGNRRAVIFCGADIADYTFFKPRQDDYIICADRGYLHARHLGLTPDIVLGDFDSLETDVPPTLPRLTFPSEKDETDLQLAIAYAVEQGFFDLYIVGATGGRTDHYLGNICLLRYAMKKGATAVIEDSRTYMRLLKGSLLIDFYTERYLSVLPLFESATVTLRGVKYPLDHAHLQVGDTIGVSNEVRGAAEIEISEGCALILLCARD